MPHRNRVTPYGDIVESPLRGKWMGNRGCIHEGHDIVRPWNGKRWITCELAFRGWTAPKWEPGRWTALFFLDEAVALAAGHRPCALCRHEDYQRFRAAFGARSADEMDARLHADRLDGRVKRLLSMRWRDVPEHAFVDIDGVAARVEDDALVTWSDAQGYVGRIERPVRGDALVITPASTVAALKNGYVLRPR
jgi:hypothetical protein